MKSKIERPTISSGFQPRCRSRRRREVGDAAFRVDQEQRVGAVLDERAKPLFAGAQRRFGVPALPLLGMQGQRMANGALERLDRQVRLAEIVGRAGLHRLDRDFLGAAAGEHDDRRLDAALPDVAQQRSGRRARRASSRRRRRRTAARQRPSSACVVRGRRSRMSASGHASPERRNSTTICGVLDRIVDDQEADRIGHGVSGGRCRRFYFRAPRKNPSMARAARCFERAAVDRAQRGRHRVAVLEDTRYRSGSRRPAADTTRCTAPRRRSPAGTWNSRGRQLPCRPLHEVGPDRQRDARAVRVAADRRRLIEAHPDADDDRRRKPDEPGVAIVVGRAGLAADRSADAERARRRAGAALDDVAQHAGHLKRDRLR